MKSIKDQITRHEGLRLKPYKDSVGILTIGVGRNLEDVGISYDEAMVLLENDINRTIKDCQTFDWFFLLDEVRKKVIIDMVFNLGLSRFRTFKNTIRAISEGRYDDASHGMLNSKWATQVGVRATRLAEMMRTGEDYT